MRAPKCDLRRAKKARKGFLGRGKGWDNSEQEGMLGVRLEREILCKGSYIACLISKLCISSGVLEHVCLFPFMYVEMNYFRIIELLFTIFIDCGNEILSSFTTIYIFFT